jgi:acyl dehydratase
VRIPAHIRAVEHDVGMAVTVSGIDELKAKAGEHLGYSEWHDVDQNQVNLFADATGDHQWIHVDPERAKKESPFGGPIAHGYLTLSLAPALLPQVLQVEGISMGVNYGCNKVRFPSPVPVGSRVRAGAQLASVEDVPGGAQVTMDVTFEVEGQEKPACVAQVVYRYYV